jgi:pimeloyl-ACP methyl ester carboxylesterase
MNYQAHRPPATTRIVFRGVSHQVSAWGNPQAEPVFLLHGWGDCGATFQFLIDSFREERYWIAPDWRGFGASEWTGPSYWFPDYLADLDAILHHYSPDHPAVLIGHSMGGNIASLYAGVRPERVSRLVNLEGVGLPHADPGAAPGRYRRWLDQLISPPTFSVYPSVDAFATVLMRRNPRLQVDRATYIAEHWLRPCEGGFTLAWDPAHKRVNPVLYSREAAEACWREATARTLLVMGGCSDILRDLGTAGEPAHYESIYPHWSVVVMPNAGHMMHHEEPTELARVIEDFLREPTI